MFLSRLKLKNFRKYKELEVPFKKGLNVLIGENDSGKTAIIDSIRILLGTQSYEFYILNEKDFNNLNDELEIECTFCFEEKSVDKVAKFLEWITFDIEKKPQLMVRLTANFKDFKVKRSITVGEKGLESRFDLIDELRITYLKPLRDANRELIAGRFSRLSQILKSHELFLNKGNDHEFIEYVQEFNENINEYFNKNEGSIIIEKINSHLYKFLGQEKESDYKTDINITEDDLNSILNSLNLSLSKNKVGLGTLNQLYMSLELLLFEIDKNSLSLCLIEELEAHLHPQAQLRTIRHLQNEFIENNQIILTTHSINLASSIKLENLILCKNNNVYPLGKEYTKLDKDDYEFLEIFLDTTKANLFFAKGVIFVEGDAENILVPTIAEIIGKPLYEYGVSVVNISGVAFKRYSRIFLRNDENKNLDIPVAIITDLDVKEESNTQGIVLDDKKVAEMNELLQSKNKNLNLLKDSIYLNIDELKSEIRELLGINTLYSGLGKIIDNFDKESINIGKYRELKKKRKGDIYNQSNIKVFLNKCQTLEYDLAISNLSYHLNNAILLTQNKETITKEVFNDTFQDKTKEDKAEKIFIKNFYTDYTKNKKSNLSKANVALNLSYFLKKENFEKIKEILLDDEYCKYIIEAINYVTTPIKDEKKGVE